MPVLTLYMEENKQKYTNKRQFELMVGILEDNPDVAKGFKFADSAVGRTKYNDVWADITATLNSVGPPTRKTVEWQKVWSDLKAKVRKKLQRNNVELRATGGGPNRQQVLSTYEETVADLMSLRRTTDHAGPSFGLTTPSPRTESSSSRPVTSSSTSGPLTSRSGISSSTSRPGISPTTPVPTDSRPAPSPSSPRASEESSDDDDEDFGAIPSSDVPPRVPLTRTPVIPRRPTPRSYRQKLLETQTEYLRELVEIGRESIQVQREQLELQKEKLQLKREAIVQAEKQRADELQFQMQVLEYKRRKLDL